MLAVLLHAFFFSLVLHEGDAVQTLARRSRCGRRIYAPLSLLIHLRLHRTGVQTRCSGITPRPRWPNQQGVAATPRHSAVDSSACGQSRTGAHGRARPLLLTIERDVI